jgi:ligand-binding SRPBCC domain-containing protein
MKVYRLDRELWVPHAVPEVFEFFAKAENLERITPPWLRFRILTPPPVQMRPGTLIAYALRVRGVPLRWVSEIEEWEPPHRFVDRQVEGPYKVWRHTHRFSSVNGGCSIADTVEYALPFGIMGRFAHRLQVARDISRIFDYRELRVRELFP